MVCELGDKPKGTFLDIIHNHTFGDILRQLRRSLPNGLAAVCGESRYTYPDLDDRTSRLANVMREAGVEEGGRVLWLGQNCHRLLEAILAAAKIGAAVCPVNWRLSPSETAFVATDTSPTIVLWQGEYGAEVLDAVRSALGDSATWIQYDGEGADDYEGRLAVASDHDPETYVDSTRPFVQMYTAAFGGHPNGALITQIGAFVHGLVYAHGASIDQDYIYLNSGPMFHIATLANTLTTFQAGGANVFTARAEPQAICELIDRERCVGAYLVEPTISRIVELNGDGRYDLSSFRPVRRERPEWHQMTQDTPDPRTTGSYGQTELIGRLSWPGLDLLGPHGRPDGSTQVRLLDDDGQEVPAGEVGEISVRGPSVLAGYHNRPELNDERMRDGWYRTNDIGRREPDGSLTFIGVKARMIKSGLENVYPAEVEACIQRHPSVAGVAVIGVPDPVWAQSVKAIVVTELGSTVTEDEIIAFCREHLASYKKPRIVEFVSELAMADGAVDYKELDSQFGGGGYPGSDIYREYSRR
jgi:long-chain acyl-CoA synthetase